MEGIHCRLYSAGPNWQDKPARSFETPSNLMYPVLATVRDRESQRERQRICWSDGHGYSYGLLLQCISLMIVMRNIHDELFYASKHTVTKASLKLLNLKFNTW